MKKVPMYRQGDILIMRVEKIPSSAKVTTDQMLAAGEHSNHGHMMIGAKVLDVADEKYVKVVDSATLRHLKIDKFQMGVQEWTDEHLDISLPAGNYKVVRQVEYNAYANTSRFLLD